MHGMPCKGSGLDGVVFVVLEGEPGGTGNGPVLLAAWVALGARVLTELLS